MYQRPQASFLLAARASYPSQKDALQPEALAGRMAEDRVGRFLQEQAQRAVSDAEIRQHMQDCTWLMERAYARFQAHGNPADREEALMWLDRRGEAGKALSQAAKDAREGQIWADIFLERAGEDRLA